MAQRLKQVERWNSAAGILMPAAALGFALHLLAHPYPALAQRAGLLFGFVFLADLAFLAMAWLRDDLRAVHLAAGGGVFLLLTIWTLQYLTVDLLKALQPDFPYLGLVPAAFAIPCLLGLFRLARPWPVLAKERLTQVALFGGAALFFITLIFPIQFERQWITIGWALEGTALLWLVHRVPHAGLRWVGVGLLVASFARLALNPWILTAYGRTGTPILNWYLYTYGIVTICLMLGGRLLAAPRHLIRELDVRPLLFGLGAVLAFALVNIEIADCFSPAGGRLRFSFSAGLGQDMTYSLAWALFAFALLAVGFKIRNAPTRYTGMGLLVVTLLKVFLHDLWQLGGLYRVGSLVGLAVVLIVVSFIYQRFLSADTAKTKGAQA